MMCEQTRNPCDTGKQARQRIAKAVSNQLGGELDNLTALQARVRQIDRTVRSLPDNITKSNRRLVDQRLTVFGDAATEFQVNAVD